MYGVFGEIIFEERKNMKSEFVGNKTFTQLKKIWTEERLNRMCKQLVLEYVDSGPEKSEAYFCRKYGIMPSCYKKMKEYAMENNLVSDEVVNKAMKKAIANQKLNCSRAGFSSVKKTFRTYVKRIQNQNNE